MLRKYVILVLVFLVGGMPAFAYRPFITEDAGVAGKGVGQVELSLDHIKWRNNDRENDLLLVPIYGMTERLEVSLEIPYLFHGPFASGDHSGLGDINIVGKYLIAGDGAQNPALALKGSIKTGTGDKILGLGSGDTDYSLIAVASKGLGNVVLHSMLGYTIVGAGGDPNIRNILQYGLAADIRLDGRLTVLCEIAGGQHPDRTAGDNPLFWMIGSTLKASDNIVYDAAIKYGLTDTAPAWDVIMGLTVTI